MLAASQLTCLIGQHAVLKCLTRCRNVCIRVRSPIVQTASIVSATSAVSSVISNEEVDVGTTWPYESQNIIRTKVGHNDPRHASASPSVEDVRSPISISTSRQDKPKFDIFEQQQISMYAKARKNDRYNRRNFRVPSEQLSLQLLTRIPRDSSKEVRAMLRAQISQARDTRDILRIVAVAVQRPRFWNDIKTVQYFLLHSLYRMRSHETDARILTVIIIVFKRLKMIGVDFAMESVGLGLTFAARARSLEGMRLFLRELRERDAQMPPNMFRHIVSKFSIGTRGFGQIRNGSWKKDELRQVLLGFSNTSDNCTPCHLATFVNRECWEMMASWIAALAWCGAKDELWAEWIRWTASDLREEAKQLTDPTAKSSTAKMRGDRWFVEQFLNAGNPREAWKAFRDSGLNLDQLRPSIKRRLLEHVTLCNTWTDDTIRAVKRMVEEDLADITVALTGEEFTALDLYE
jgi:hypothetical protein